MKINAKYKLAGLAAASMMAATSCDNDATDKYIVETKGNYKVLIHSLKNPADRHAICFMPDVAGHGQYTMIQPGDTLTCDARVRDALMISDRNWEGEFTVKKLNGRTFQEIRESRMLKRVQDAMQDQK